MQNLDSNRLIRASEIQSLLKCSKQYAYNVLNQLNPITLAYTAKQPPKAALRADFERWVSDNHIVLEGGV